MSETETGGDVPANVSVLTPFLYLGFLVTTFVVFAIQYRKRRLAKMVQRKPLLKENYAAEIYQQLKSLAEKPHDRVLKAALIRRAADAVLRSIKLRELEPGLNKLYQDGLVGEDIHKQFEIESKVLEFELKDILQECDTYKKGWAPTFFPVSQEVCMNEALRRRLKIMNEREAAFAELWQIESATSAELNKLTGKDLAVDGSAAESTSPKNKKKTKKKN